MNIEPAALRALIGDCTRPYGPVVVSLRVGVCVMCRYTPGGLLRKPPLKCAQVTHAARITYGYAHSTWIRSPALNFVQHACLYMGLRPVQTYVRV